MQGESTCSSAASSVQEFPHPSRGRHLHRASGCCAHQTGRTGPCTEPWLPSVLLKPVLMCVRALHLSTYTNSNAARCVRVPQVKPSSAVLGAAAAPSRTSSHCNPSYATRARPSPIMHLGTLIACPVVVPLPLCVCLTPACPLQACRAIVRTHSTTEWPWSPPGAWPWPPACWRLVCRCVEKLRQGRTPNCRHASTEARPTQAVSMAS